MLWWTPNLAQMDNIPSSGSGSRVEQKNQNMIASLKNLCYEERLKELVSFLLGVPHWYPEPPEVMNERLGTDYVFQEEKEPR